VKPCDRCGLPHEKCRCRRIELPHCGLCSREAGRGCFNWIGKPNPFGAWRGEVFSHFECKDKEGCAERRLKEVG
jgi:hypothetical protein